jgi:hypothetical protein
MKKESLLFSLLIIVTGIFIPQAAAPASSITISDSEVYLTPASGDYAVGFVAVEGVSGIRVRVTTDNPTGAILYVKCTDASPQIALSDLLVKSPTSGAIITTYTAITAADQALWSDNSTFNNQSVDTDVKVLSLWTYSDASGGGTTDHTNTLTYTIVEQ